ncbi:hypothetical protein LTR36_001466 [Oleoguttula mirabilis]|uniref:Uncharacterized protein n=1 Tax=Oleoguttula mirabilis TaxID=1507867 RepID=A0AAV9J2R7_9PEZI|nr:hypothetical protein LTR36_001466 [Oleoguttula mirabilis]
MQDDGAVRRPITGDSVVDGYLDASKNVASHHHDYDDDYDGYSGYGLGSANPSFGKNEVHDLLKHRQQLEWSARKLRELHHCSTSTDPTMTDQALAAVEDTASALRSVIAHALGWDPLATLPSRASRDKAQKVFGTPESTEMILLHLSVEDQLSAMRVCKSISAAISASPRIQVRLGLRANPLASGLRTSGVAGPATATG